MKRGPSPGLRPPSSISLLPLAGEGAAKRRMRAGIAAAILFLAYACATTAPQPAKQQIEIMHGMASWYGQEFAGRTTADGEIFDPMLLTAAHRTLPFGTLVEVRNPKTSQTVRVRINDRGPYVGDRLIDLSYAAAKVIGLIEPGSGEVDLNVITMGKGEREPPAPYTVTVATVADVPVVAMPTPAPAPVPIAPSPAPAPAIVDQVQVIEEHHAVETRKQVAPNGRTLEAVPVKPSEPRAPSSERVAAPRPAGRFVIQVGAFADEKNAVALQQKLRAEGFESFIDRGPTLHKVQIGPFETRDQAVKTRGALEAAGISAILITAAPTR
jgi:rare lipoprotein A